MKYAIVETGGKQYKVVEGETIEVDRLPVETGQVHKLDQVLLLADGEQYNVGKPVINDTPIWTRVVAHFRGEKVTIFNYRPKKRIRIKTGHRQNYTRLLVEQIGGSTLVKKEIVRKEEPVKKVEASVKAETKPDITAPKQEVTKKETKAAPVKKETKPATKKAGAGKPATGKTTPKAAPKAKTSTVTKKPATKTPTGKTAKK